MAREGCGLVQAAALDAARRANLTLVVRAADDSQRTIVTSSRVIDRVADFVVFRIVTTSRTTRHESRRHVARHCGREHRSVHAGRPLGTRLASHLSRTDALPAESFDEAACRASRMSSAPRYGGSSVTDASEVIRRCRLLAEHSEEGGFTTRTFLSRRCSSCTGMSRQWMHQAGMDVLVDAAGNIHGLYRLRSTMRRDSSSALTSIPCLGPVRSTEFLESFSPSLSWSG